jgi:hypothetical protein
LNNDTNICEFSPGHIYPRDGIKNVIKEYLFLFYGSLELDRCVCGRIICLRNYHQSTIHSAIDESNTRFCANIRRFSE